MRKAYPTWFAAGALAVYGVFVLLPSLLGLGYAFTDWSSYSSDIHWVGLDNFKTILEPNSVYRVAIVNTVLFTIATIVLKTAIALALAVLLTSGVRRLSYLYRALIYLPALLPMVAVGIVFKSIFDPEVGLLGNAQTTPDTVDTPSFLKTADRARAYLNSLQSQAESTGRYFKSNTTINDSVNNPMFTFVDGDCTLEGGSGFLVVTGTLTMRGNPNFKGAILVLGTGVLIRNGGGNGDIYGGIAVAAFNRTAGNFTAPTFSTNGGGNSTIQYDSLALKNGIGSGTNVSGIREF